MNMVTVVGRNRGYEKSKGEGLAHGKEDIVGQERGSGAFDKLVVGNESGELTNHHTSGNRCGNRYHNQQRNHGQAGQDFGPD